MEAITVVSLMSNNHRALYQGVAEHLGRRAGMRTLFVTEAPWQECEQMLDQGRAQVGFICGLPYTRKTDRFELLAAPVMRAARYGDRPVYFSDVVVRADSPFQSFADLRGATWAYNEPGSWSGCVVLRAHLAALGETASYCGRVVESGAHLRSLEMILDGAVDAAAIDSAVLEMEQARRPRLAAQIRIVESFGPNMFPPTVIRREVHGETKRRIRAALLAMHEDPEGEAILAAGQVARFAPVDDADYDTIRQKARHAERVRFEM